MNLFLPFRAREAVANAATTLFCLPHAGGAASAYQEWTSVFPTVDVQPVQLPGREGLLRHEPAPDFAALVDLIGEALAPELGPRYALFGHSMGATLAAELTAWFDRRGLLLPELLVVSARGGRPEPAGPSIPSALLTDDDDAVVRHVLSLGGTDPAVFLHRELRDLAVRVTRADLALCRSYRRTYDRLPVPILAIGGQDDPMVDGDELEAWRAHTSRSFRSVTFEGGHFFLRGRLRSVAAEIGRDLAPATSRAGAEEVTPTAAPPSGPNGVPAPHVRPASRPNGGNPAGSAGAARLARRARAAVVARTGLVAPNPTGQTDGVVPLSGPQWSVWLHGKLHRRTRQQLVTWVGRLTGDVAVPALVAALTEVTGRHPVLNSTVRMQGREAFLHLGAAPADVRVARLDDVPEPRRAHAALSLVRQRWEAVDPERGPILAATVVPVSPTECLVGVAVHHVVFDGRSLRLLLDEVAARCSNCADPPPPPRAVLPPGPPPERSLAFWLDLLTDVPALTFPRPPSSTEAGRHRMAVEPGMVRALRETATRCRATPVMVVLAALALRLRAYAERPDLVVGIPVDIREAARAEEIGCFANTLPLRVRWSEAPGRTFADVVADVRRDAIAALGHRDAPVAEITEALRRTGGLRHYPLFDVVFNYINREFQELRLPGVDCEVLDTVGGTAEFALMVTVHDDGDGMEVVLEPRADAFDRETVVEFGRRFLSILAAATSDPDRVVDDLFGEEPGAAEPGSREGTGR